MNKGRNAEKNQFKPNIHTDKQLYLMEMRKQNSSTTQLPIHSSIISDKHQMILAIKNKRRS
jgi:hypothetical protein